MIKIKIMTLVATMTRTTSYLITLAYDADDDALGKLIMI